MQNACTWHGHHVFQETKCGHVTLIPHSIQQIMWYSTNVGSMLAQRLRRRPNRELALIECIVVVCNLVTRILSPCPIKNRTGTVPFYLNSETEFIFLCQAQTPYHCLLRWVFIPITPPPTTFALTMLFYRIAFADWLWCLVCASQLRPISLRSVAWVSD